MRVAHIINSLTKASGLSFFCANMAQHLAELGVDIDLYVWWIGDDALVPDHERIHVYETKDTGFNPVVKPDIVHVHSMWVSISHQGCAYARKNGIPYVFSPHGTLTSWALRHKWWKKLPGMILYQYKDLRRASVLHATAQGEVANIRSLLLNQDVAIVPLGTDLPPCSAVEHAADDAIRTVLFLGRVHPVKGLMNLIQAWASVTQDPTTGPPVHWRLILAGPDTMGHKAELTALAESLTLTVQDLSENVSATLEQIHKDTDIVFTGSVYGEDKNRLYAMADLFVLPSFTENFGAVVTDSLAFEVPVITTKGTPWSELEGEEAELPVDGESLIVDRDPLLVDRDPSSVANAQRSTLNAQRATGRCGWWVEIGVEPLVAALREAMNMTDAERRAFGRNGRQLVEAKYTWPAVAGEMKQVYERMLIGR
jgi:glycosyltransferase involved in cell wall biosynthesis